jgi:hypothetical protein
MRDFLNRPAIVGGLFALVACVMWAAGTSSAGDKKDGLKVKEGQPAPAVELPATQIGTVLPEQKDADTLRLSDLKGKKHVVLYFFPKALTGG